MNSEKKILVINDLQTVSSILEHLLKDNRKVLRAENDKDAKRLLERYGDEIGLIICDGDISASEVKYDWLTGLYNKRYFQKELELCLKENPDKLYDVIYADVEHFKLINDAFGIQTGDRLLMHMAQIYRKCLPREAICGRIGGDEIAILMEHDEQGLEDMLGQLAGSFREMPEAKNIVVKWGIYTVRERGLLAEQICDRAALAMKSIKGKYGKDHVYYSEMMRSRLIEEQQLERDMERALANREFILYFQPKYEIGSHKIIGAEALVRWQHPERGLLMPSGFIPIFEQNGFITRMDEYVWQEACRIMKNWGMQGGRRIPVSVNVSRMDFYREELPEIFTDIVSRHGLGPQDLHLEITESAYMEEQERMIRMVRELRRRGFVVEMDDFGKGYSSLHMLSELPVDLVKMDIRFVQCMDLSGDEIIRYVVSLSDKLGLKLLAEGVETKEQEQRLLELGCKYAQGFYFGKPCAECEFVKMMDLYPPS